MPTARCGDTRGHEYAPPPPKKRKEKLKYKSLCTEIQRMWNMEFMILLVITGATRLVIKS